MVSSYNATSLDKSMLNWHNDPVRCGTCHHSFRLDTLIRIRRFVESQSDYISIV
jgi:hypothetical protein